jgi:hypothetical protein
MKDGGQLPTQKQIMYGWKVSPVARNIALILRDFAIEQEHPKVTIAVNKLSQITDAGEMAVNSGLDELQDKGFVESDRPNAETRRKLALADQKKKAGEARPRKPYYFRLHVGNSKNYKDHS